MSATPDRDRLLEDALGRALPRDAEASDACLDAETLAAWMDRGLDPAAAAQAEAHVSACARCQALVATMAQTESVEADHAPARASLWRWWLAPLAAAAAATTIWIVMPAPAPAPPVPEAVVAEAPLASPQAPLPAPVAEAPPPGVAESAKAADARRETAAEVSPPEAEARGAAPAPRAEAAAPAAPPTIASEPLRDRASGPPPDTAPGIASPERVQAQAAREAPAEALRAASPLEVAAPDGIARWRIAAGRVVERSSDGGRTWSPVAGGLDGDALAGAAPSAEVCWFVGAAGAVWRMTDGGTFARTGSPAALDLVGVTAADGRSAIVSAADGRRFQTRDGGTTWAEVRE